MGVKSILQLSTVLELCNYYSAGMLQLMSTVLVDFFVGLFTWIYHGTFLPN